jgi:hypothetical protein
MILIHGTWNNKPTFKLIPIEQNCPYNEAIYDTDQHVLALIGKEKKETFQLVPKVNDKGDAVLLQKVRANGKHYAEERRVLETWYEYYIENKNDIIYFISLFAKNLNDFDYKSFLKKEAVIEPPIVK